MIPRFLTLALTLALALIGLAILGRTPAWAQQWPVNGDFSQGGQPPAGWFLDPEAARKGSIRITGPDAAGRRVLELAPNAANTPSEKPLGLGQLLPAGPFRGREVTVAAALGATGGAHAVLGLAVLRKGGGGETVLLRDDGAAEPAARQDRLSVPDDAAIEGLVLFLTAEGTGGTARFAAVSVTAAAAASVTPAAPAQAATVLPAAVRIDTTRVRRRIPRTLFGTNIEVIRDANGLWDANAQRLEPRIVQLAREMGVSLVRFPGGVWSDAYDWRNGIGPQADRKTTLTHPGADERYRHVFGTDEALTFARNIGAGLLITVNAATGTPAMAADWVRYVNGNNRSGGSGPARVQYWEIGNELYMAGDMSGGHMTPESYAERVLAFAAAMRAADPTITIGAIGLRNYGRYRFAERDDWNEVVLRRAGAAIDMLMVHNAYSPLVGEQKGLDPAQVYAALWAAPTLIAANLRDTWKDVERLQPDRAARMSLGITEWGPLYAATPGSPWVDHVKTLGSAIYVAAALKAFAEDPHVTVANFFKLNEASFMGWIGRSGSAWIPTAPYRAFQMVATRMEPDLLASSVEVASYDSRAIGFVDRVRGVPYLDVLATRSEDGRILTVLLISKHPSAAIDATLALDGSAGADSLRSETLTGPAVDANTGTQLPAVPGLRWAPQQRFGTAGRIDRGSLEEVRLDSQALAPPGATVTVRVPPYSMTLLRFEGVRGR
ncbi:MAG: hypothetical protein WDN25_12300 [Acetobacteraceae bacterium]